MMLKSAFSSKASPVRGRERTVPELRDPVSLTSDSLNKLNGKFQFKRDSGVNTSLSYQHIPVQEAKGKRTKLASQESVTSCEQNIDLCIDLLERLERAEELALKIKNVRENVDRIAQRLRQSSPMRSKNA